jgi:hypothetical protein
VIAHDYDSEGETMKLRIVEASLTQGWQWIGSAYSRAEAQELLEEVELGNNEKHEYPIFLMQFSDSIVVFLIVVSLIAGAAAIAQSGGFS